MSISAVNVAPEFSFGHFHFSPHVGKLSFLKNLCPNGCLGHGDRDRFEDNEPVYLNHKCQIEPFKHNVNMPEDSHIKSYRRVEYIVKETFVQANGDYKEQLFQRIQEKADLNIDEEKRLRRTLTYSKLKRIERAVNHVSKEHQSPIAPISPRLLKDLRVQRFM